MQLDTVLVTCKKNKQLTFDLVCSGLGAIAGGGSSSLSSSPSCDGVCDTCLY